MRSIFVPFVATSPKGAIRPLGRYVIILDCSAAQDDVRPSSFQGTYGDTAIVLFLSSLLRMFHHWLSFASQLSVAVIVLGM